MATTACPHTEFLRIGAIAACRTTEEATVLGSGMKREWRESCIAAHPNWTYMFWDRAAALKLLNNRYPWFTKTFLSYRKVVSQGTHIKSVQ